MQNTVQSLMQCDSVANSRISSTSASVSTLISPLYCLGSESDAISIRSSATESEEGQFKGPGHRIALLSYILLSMDAIMASHKGKVVGRLKCSQLSIPVQMADPSVDCYHRRSEWHGTCSCPVTRISGGSDFHG